MRKKRLFLLGGSDLEMEEIRNLLDSLGCIEFDSENMMENRFEGCAYVDRNLSWGAKLSDYRNVLERFGDRSDIILYGIELTEDITPPRNYVAIDHHNERADRPSSLEQVAELFGVKLDRWQRLVAANDKGYIPEMKKMCATDAEIEKIRRADRKAQGVSLEEEKSADALVLQCEKSDSTAICTTKNGYFQIETTLKHFSPLVDRFYMLCIWPLLVYNPNKKTIGFYGTEIQIDKLVKAFSSAIKEKKAWFGGNPKGYFGIGHDYFKNHDMEETLQKIEKTLHQKITPYSHHIFMFPFRFDWTGSLKDNLKPNDRHRFYKKVPFNERVDIEKLYDKLTEAGWRLQPFRTDRLDDEGQPTPYNEYVYYHEFVRDALFNPNETFENDATSHYFDKELDEKAKYIIKIRENGKDREYELHLKTLSLRLFDTGVGLLSFECFNYDYRNIEDVLRINDFGRRIYPQFLGKDKTDSWAEKPIDSFLPVSITMRCQEMELTENFKAAYQTKLPPDNPPKLSNVLLEVLGAKIFSTSINKGKYLLQPVIDDRMYVVCWMGDDACSERCKNYEKFDLWYRFVFLDGKWKNITDEAMQQKLVEASTYPRWRNSGALYGISRYSFVCMTNRSDFALGVLRIHMRTIYYQMATLLLAQRASILRFSDEVAALSDIETGRKTELSEKTSILYKAYIRFVNKLYFREVTPQDQGIELYEMAHDVMKVERDIKDLDAEIAELHNYTDLLAEKNRNDRLELMSVLGAIFLPPTLLAGLFGMNMIDFNQRPLYAFFALVAIFATGWFGYMAVTQRDRETSGTFDFVKSIKDKKPLRNIVAIIAITFFSILFYILISPCKGS